MVQQVIGIISSPIGKAAIAGVAAAVLAEAPGVKKIAAVPFNALADQDSGYIDLNDIDFRYHRRAAFIGLAVAGLVYFMRPSISLTGAQSRAQEMFRQTQALWAKPPTTIGQ